MPSLHEFGRAVDCDFTTASRLLSGERAPSTRLLARICKAYDLDEGEALRTLAKDQETDSGKTPIFAEYLKEKVFGGEVRRGRPPKEDVTEVTSGIGCQGVKGMIE